MQTPMRILLAAAVATALTSCAGQRMTKQPTVPSGDGQAQSDVRMVPITQALVAAPRETVTVPASLAQYKPEIYRIQPGDTLLVTVWDHPELTSPAGSQQQAVTNGRLVQPDGSFFFPYAGKLDVNNKTIEEVRSTLVGKLSQYLKSPQIDVNVVGHGAKVTLQGAFEDTAPQSFTTVPLTLSQAVGQARINVEEADLAGFVLTRDGQDYPLDLDALNRNGKVAGDVYLKPGDRLYLPFNDRKQVYVIGEVLRPQALTFKTTDMSLTQALGQTGGLNPVTAKGDAVYVIRGMDDNSHEQATVYHLEAGSPVAFTLADRFPLRPGDVVWVGPAGVTRWNRFLTQLLPLSGIISNAASAQYNFDRN